jgi:hypothetical protein
MSQINTWASQYKQLAAFTEDINESVGVIIKQKLLTERPELTEHPGIYVADEEISNARTMLTDLLVSLVGEGPGQAPPDEPTTGLPDVLIDDYRERLHKNKTAQVRFGELRDRLLTDEPVNDRDKQVLDDIMITLDSSCKQFFRNYRY